MVVLEEVSFVLLTSVALAASEVSSSSSCVACSAHCFASAAGMSHRRPYGTRWRYRGRGVHVGGTSRDECRAEASWVAGRGTEAHSLSSEKQKGTRWACEPWNQHRFNLPSNDSISFGLGWKNHWIKAGSFQSGSLNAFIPSCGRWTPGLWKPCSGFIGMPKYVQ